MPRALLLLPLVLPLAAATLAPQPAAASCCFPRLTDTAPRALVLEPFATALGQSHTAGLSEAALLQRAGYTVTVLRDAQVSVPVMKRLARYSFVYIDTHAGPLPNDDAAIATGDTRYHRFAPYFANYSLAQMRIADATGRYRFFDAITGRFIDRYNGRFSAHSIVFVNSCNALDMSLFWRYLRQNGVSTLISWHHHVSTVSADRASRAVLTALANGENVSEAIGDAVMMGAGYSDTGGKHLGELSFLGDGSNTLPAARFGAITSD